MGIRPNEGFFFFEYIQKIVTKMDETNCMFIEMQKIIMYHEK